MGSKKLFFKWSVVIRDIRNYWPAWVIPSIGYLLSVTCFLGITPYYSRAEMAKELLSILSGASVCFSYGLGLVVSFCCFGYLGNRKKHYMFEALPASRLEMFATRFVTGFIMMTIPSLVIYVAEIIQTAAQSGNVPISELSLWLLMNTVMNLFWFAFGILFMVLCGRLLMAGFCYVAFSLAGLVFEYLLYVYNSYMFVGFFSTFESEILHLGIVSPLEYMLNNDLYYGELGSNYTVQVLLIATGALLFGIASILLYKVRKAERTGDNIVFDFMKTVFSCCASFIFSMIMTFIMIGILFTESEGIAHYTSYRVCIVTFVIIFSAVGYFASGMIIEKKFGVFRKYLVKALIFTGIMTVLCILYLHDIFGIEKYIPAKEDISRCQINGEIYHTGWENIFYDDNCVSTDDEKQAVLDFHEIIVKNMDEVVRYYQETGDEDRYDEYGDISVYPYDQGFLRNICTVHIIYVLNNGKEICRTYYIKPGGKLYEELEAYTWSHEKYIEKTTITNYLKQLDKNDDM